MQTITTRFDIVDALQNLNESQKSSLDAKFPFFVNGPAGSGKSVVLIARLHKLIKEGQETETETGILVTTFNKKIISMIFCWLKRLQTDQTTNASSENRQIIQNSAERKIVKIGNVTVYLIHFDALTSQREGIDPKLVDFHEMISTDFSKDTEDISNYYGKIGFIDHKDDDQNNNIEQQKQSGQLGLIARKLIWLDRIKNENACRAFKGGSEAVCEPYTQQEFKFDYIFIDECQDLWLADLCLFWHLLREPGLWRIGCFGDATQAVHVGASKFRNNVLKVPKPLQKLAPDKKPRTFNKAACMLEETYRIPQHLTKSLELIREKVVPANKAKSNDSNPNNETRNTEQNEDEDARGLKPVKYALPGTRLIFVYAKSNNGPTWENAIAEKLKKILLTYSVYSPNHWGERNSDYPTTMIMEDDVNLCTALKETLKEIPEIKPSTILKEKGLEFPCVIWSTRIPVVRGQHILENVYTILTRATCLGIIAWSDDVPDTDTKRATKSQADECLVAYKEIIQVLKKEDILFFDKESEDKFDQLNNPESTL